MKTPTQTHVKPHEGHADLKINVYDPLAEYLGGPVEAARFGISILDAARLAGHLCPSVAGAFLATRKAIETLYPDTNTCVRGQIEVDLPGLRGEGATGPVSHVISYITGAWSESGFGGISGNFSRRNLLHYHSSRCVDGCYRFERTDTHQVVQIRYQPGLAKLSREIDDSDENSFGEAWQARVNAILASPEVIEVMPG